METVLVALIALACPLGMGLCMWMMARHMRGGSERPDAGQRVRPSLAELRAERDHLDAEVARAERDAANGAGAGAPSDAPIQRT